MVFLVELRMVKKVRCCYFQEMIFRSISVLKLTRCLIEINTMKN